MVLVNPDEKIWFQKYRPQTVDDCILPKDIKKVFQKFVEIKELPNLILTGASGTGKTTVAKAMLNQLGYDTMFINASLSRGIDLLRNDIAAFASTLSWSGGRKFVILDEADALLPNGFQPALRGFMEEFSVNCGFILTCNYLNKIIDPIRGRCSIIDFTVPSDERTEMVKGVSISMMNMLKNENIEFDPKAVVVLVDALFPNVRRIVNELQRYSTFGKVDTGIMASLKESSFEEVISYIKEKKWTEMRRWVGENSDLEFSVVTEKMVNLLMNHIENRSIPQLILIVNKYDYQNAMVSNREINTAACFTEMMTELQFKK